jgi:segregation and condensation protein A
VVSPEVEPNEGPEHVAPTGTAYSVRLPAFEGPLDLLLHLCQKHELNILDIPIGFVTEKYLEYLAVMQLLDLDIASEYLVMAATLAHIKSKLLLPAPPPGQEDDVTGEEEDPREALIRRLLEYQKYKQAGADLQSRGVAGRDVFGRGMPLEEAVHTGVPPLARVPLFSLVEAFQGVLSKSKVKLSHDIVHERITLTDRINELVDLLRTKKRLVFEELFDGLSTRFDLVITFLAVLEMTKLRMTRLHQSEPMAPIYVEFSAQVEAERDGDPASDEPPAEDTIQSKAPALPIDDVSEREASPELAPASFDTIPPEDAPSSSEPPVTMSFETHGTPPFATIPSPPPSDTPHETDAPDDGTSEDPT